MFGSYPGPYHYLCQRTRNQWLICSSYNFYDTSVVVNLAVCSINSVGYILCCQLPFDIIIDFSCHIFLDRIKCKRERYGVSGSCPDISKQAVDFLRLKNSACNGGCWGRGGMTSRVGSCGTDLFFLLFALISSSRYFSFIFAQS